MDVMNIVSAIRSVENGNYVFRLDGSCYIKKDRFGVIKRINRITGNVADFEVTFVDKCLPWYTKKPFVAKNMQLRFA